jgi:hypothetical protein
MNEIPSELLLLIVPLLLVQVGLAVLGLWDLTRPGRRRRGGSRLVWGVLIVFVNVFGDVCLVGREESRKSGWRAAAPARAR